MAVLRVPLNYPSVAAAVAAASAGDTIEVAAGYATTEAVAVSVDNLTFNGGSAAQVTLTLSDGVGTVHVGGRLPFAVVGGATGASIYGTRPAANGLTGGEGADRLYAQAGDSVSALGGDDVIFVREGTPASIDGGQGNDLLRIIGNVVFAAGTVAGVERFTVANEGDADFGAVDYGVVVKSLSVAGGAAAMAGTAFDDVFFSNVGADEFAGNGGNDTVSYRNAPSGVVADLAVPVSNTGWASGDTYAGIENLTGTNSADRLTGDGNSNRLDGGAGNDILNGGAGDTLIGGEGNDLFNVSGAADAAVSITIRGGDSTGSDRDTLQIVSTVRFDSSTRITDVDEVLVANGVVGDFSAVHGNIGTYRSQSVAGDGTTVEVLAGAASMGTYVFGGQGADTLIGADDSWTGFGLFAEPVLVDARAGGGNLQAFGSMRLDDANVHNIHDFQAVADLDLSGITYSGVNLFGGLTSTLVGTDLDDRIVYGAVVTAGKGADFLEAWATDTTYVYEDGDSGLSADTADTFDSFQSGDRFHLVGVTPSEAIYGTARIATNSFVDAVSTATALMQAESKQVAFIAGPDQFGPAWLVWNSSGGHVPEQAVFIQATDTSSFSWTYLV